MPSRDNGEAAKVADGDAKGSSTSTCDTTVVTLRYQLGLCSNWNAAAGVMLHSTIASASLFLRGEGMLRCGAVVPCCDPCDRAVLFRRRYTSTLSLVSVKSSILRVFIARAARRV